MTMVVAMVVAAAEAGTWTVATAAATGNKRCPAVAEATIAVQATLVAAPEVPAKVPTTSSGGRSKTLAVSGSQTKVPSSNPWAAMLPGYKTSEGKSQKRQGSHLFSHLFSILSVTYSLWQSKVLMT
jgi:hypothetical protein